MDATQDLHFFPPSHGPVEVPIKTTLSNTQDPTAASMSIVLSPDQVGANVLFLFLHNCCVHAFQQQMSGLNVYAKFKAYSHLYPHIMALHTFIQVLSPDSGAPNVRIVHSMPNRNEPIEGDLPGKLS